MEKSVTLYCLYGLGRLAYGIEPEFAFFTQLMIVSGIYSLHSIYSSILNGLGVLGARLLFSPRSTDHLHDIRLYALCFRHFIVLASYMNNCNQAI